MVEISITWLLDDNNQQIAVYESDNSCIGPTNINILVSQEIIKMQKIGKYKHTY